MKLSFPQALLLPGFLFLQLVSIAQDIQEEPPPPEFVQQLEALAAPQKKDTVEHTIMLTMKSKKYKLSTYIFSKRFRSTAAVAENQYKLRELIEAKPTAAYQTLELIKRLRDTANYLCKQDFAFNEDNPFQHKIAYSWGAKEYLKRQNPPGDGDNCTNKIHGLDCSGFIYQLFKLNGIKLPASQCNADTERKPTFLTSYLKPYFGTKAFEVKDMEQLGIKEIQSGDIIYFKNSQGRVYHIGILFVNEVGEVVLYQSLGQPNRRTDNDIICQTNLNNQHGPVIKVITDKFLKGLNKQYGCIRIIGSHDK